MNGDEMRKRWNGLSEEIVSGMAEWREQHPKATFREIETEVDKRLAVLRAQMLSDAAIRSAQAEWDRVRGSGVPKLRSKIRAEREEEAQAANTRRPGCRVRARIWSLSEVWTRDFSPG